MPFEAGLKQLKLLQFVSRQVNFLQTKAYKRKIAHNKFVLVILPTSIVFFKVVPQKIIASKFLM